MRRPGLERPLRHEKPKSAQGALAGLVNGLFRPVHGVIAGCETIRAHDAGRSEGAGRARESAEELTQKTAGVFKPMQENLEAAWRAQDAARALMNAHDRETFDVVFPFWEAETLGVRFAEAMEDRARALGVCQMTVFTRPNAP